MIKEGFKATCKQNKLILAAFLVAAILGVIVYFAWPYLSMLSDQEQTRKIITDAGAWGPLVFVLLQVAQVLIAPIPGQVVGLIGGYLFGPLLGVVYTMIGATIGFTLIFTLTRKLGRPFVERFVNKKALERFDYLTKEKGVLVFFFIFLLPVFPDDIISFVAGLTAIKIRTLVLISLAGRLPGYIMLSLAGNGIAYENLSTIIATGAAILILFIVAWYKRAWLKEFAEHKNRIAYIRETWNKSCKQIIVWVAVLSAIIAAIYILAGKFY